MESTVCAYVHGLINAFSAPPGNKRAARAAEGATATSKEILLGNVPELGPNSAIERKLTDFSDTMADLNGRVQAFNVSSCTMLSAAMSAIHTCGVLACKLKLPSSDAFPIAYSALQLVFGKGWQALAALREQQQGRLQREQQQQHKCGGRQRRQQQKHGEQRQQQGALLRTMALRQLCAVQAMLMSFQCGSTDEQWVAAALPPPRTLVQWLADLTRTLLACCAPGESLAGEGLLAYVHLAYELVISADGEEAAMLGRQHGEALAADCQLQQDIVRLMLQHCLPGMAADAAGACPQAPGTGSSGSGSSSAAQPVRSLSGRSLSLLTVTQLALALTADSLAPAVQQASDAAAVRHASRLLATLSACEQLEGLRDEHKEACLCTAQLLCTLSKHTLDKGRGSAETPSSGSSAGSDITRQPCNSSSSSDEEWEAAAWGVMRVVPHLATVLQAAGSEELAMGLCAEFLQAVEFVRQISSIDSPQQLAAWAAAADAGLRLLPHLEKVDSWALQQGLFQAREQREPPCEQEEEHQPSEQEGQKEEQPPGMEQQQPPEMEQWPSGQKALTPAGLLAGALVPVLWGQGSKRAYAYIHADRQGSSKRRLGSAAQQLWGLHTTSCRFLHWLLQEPGRHALVQLPPPPKGWELVMGGLQHVVLAATAGPRKADAGSESRLTAGLAIMEAGRAVFGAVAAQQQQAQPQQAQQGGAQYDRPWKLSLAACLVCCMPGPAWRLADEQLLRTLLSSLALGDDAANPQEGQGAEVDEMRVAVAGQLVGCACREPQLAFSLVQSGFMALLLENTRKLGTAGGTPTKRPLDWSGCCLFLLEALGTGVQQVLEELEGTGSCSEVGGSATAAGNSDGEQPPAPASAGRGLAQRLRAALDSFWDESNGDAEAADSESLAAEEETDGLYWRMLQPSAVLAEQAQQAWQQSGLADAARLEAAQAAATRSCAYLACSNLAGEGGPAAGEGVGSKRCGQCRAVWYCGAACQQRDWRVGHKRVCKALAAARAAEKQQQARAAAKPVV